MKEGLRITRRTFIRLGIVGGLGLIGGKGFFNSRRPELVKMSVTLQRLPPVFDGLKVGQISDIHTGPLVPAGLINKGVELLSAEKPDLIVLTGDFVSGATKFLWTTYGGFKQRHFDDCMRALGRLSAPLGVCGVLGNHDFWSGPGVLKKIVHGLERVGVRVLRNEALALERKGEKVHVAGVDDYWESSYNLTKALQGVPEDACRILLSHNPDVNEDIDNMKERLDFIISGHTHGGQVVLPFAGALYIPSPFGQKYLAGLVRDGKRQTYISRGLGLFFVPIRINSPADVSLLTLRSEASQ
jgi:predicted MPP superfamily phosphohydrolase